MTFTDFKTHFKAHPLLHAVAFSAVMHLLAFIIFPTWNKPSLPDREKPIKVKYLQERKEVPAEKVFPEPEKTTDRKKTISKKIPEILKPNPGPRSAIIKNTEIVAIPPHYVKRNPVPIHNSENAFRPVTAILKHASVPHPVSAYTMKAQPKRFPVTQPSPRLKRHIPMNPGTAIPLSEATMRSPDTSATFNKLNQVKPLQPALRLTTASASTIQTSHDPTVAIKSFTEINGKSIQKSSSPASSKLIDKKLLPPKTVATPKTFPGALREMLSIHHPVMEIKNVAATGTPTRTITTRPPQTLNIPGSVVTASAEVSKSFKIPKPLLAIRPQSPQSLDAESISQYQPAISLAANYLSSPLQRPSLLKETSIPPGFSDEKLNQEVVDRPPEKVARLNDGVHSVSPELLEKIKSRFSSQIWNRIARSKYYPRIARKRGFEGQPVVAFTLGHEGTLLELSIATPSPFKVLDKAALDAVKSAGPYPPIPKLLKADSIQFNLPISFMLEEQ